MQPVHCLHKTLARRLCRSEQGVAAVEFALIVPILLILYLGAVDVSQGIAADRKLASVAGMIGDLVAQTPDERLPASTLNDYFSASRAIMQPFAGDETAVLVTIVSVDEATGNARVVASQPHNGATRHPRDSLFPLPDEIRNLARGGHVVVSEAWYTYRPVIGYVLTADIGLYKRFFHIPRFGGRIDIQ